MAFPPVSWGPGESWVSMQENCKAIELKIGKLGALRRSTLTAVCFLPPPDLYFSVLLYCTIFR